MKAQLASSVKPAVVERVEARTEQLGDELKQLLRQQEQRGEEGRSTWEDRLTTRQMNLESTANECRRDWHRLAAQVRVKPTSCSLPSPGHQPSRPDAPRDKVPHA
jgi:hypothetical protein